MPVEAVEMLDTIEFSQLCADVAAVGSWLVVGDVVATGAWRMLLNEMLPVIVAGTLRLATSFEIPTITYSLALEARTDALVVAAGELEESTKIFSPAEEIVAHTSCQLPSA